MKTVHKKNQSVQRKEFVEKTLKAWNESENEAWMMTLLP